jgi:hypothetical protein
MSKKIDYDNLSEDDRQYLADRPWLPQPEDELTSDGDDDDSDGDSDEDLTVPYDALSFDELKEECERRGLKKSGGIEELIARLEADDEA